MGNSGPTVATLIGPGSRYPILGSSPATWRMAAGVNPVMTTVDIPAFVEGDGGEVAVKNASEMEGSWILHLEAGGNAIDFRAVYPLRQLPGNVPAIVRQQLADRRVWWPYAHIGPRRYNWRRNTSFKRLRDIRGPTPALLEDVAPVIQYAPWSIKENGEPWTAREVLLDVLKTLREFEVEQMGDQKGFVRPSIYMPGAGAFEGGVAGQLDEIPVENLIIDDPGHQAVARVLSVLPGWEIFIDREGNYRVFQTASGLPPMVSGPSKVGGGLSKVVFNSRMRPKKIHVLFTRECEVRFDFWEEDKLPTGSIVPGVTETRMMKNVLGIPDFDILINGSFRPMGSWCDFDDALRTWNREPNADGTTGCPGFGAIDYPLIRKALVPFLDLWGGILALGQREPQADWQGRVNAIVQNYRTTFQINQKFWSRILSIKASRLALIDQATGAMAPAAVFADYCRIGSQRSFFRDIHAGVDLAYAMNVKGYPLDQGAGLLDPADRFPIDSVTKFSPARVSIADPEQGVIRIAFTPDMTRMYEMVLPAMIEITSGGRGKNGMPILPGPTANITNRLQPITFDMISDQMGVSLANIPQLTAEHRVAIILTAVPAAWNLRDEEGKVKNHQLHDITIDPERDKAELEKLLVQGSNIWEMRQGPEMYIRVGSGTEVAKIAWIDSRKDDIERVFSMGDGKEPDLTGLVLNEGDSTKGASLNAIALAVAAQTLSEMADHIQGAETVGLQYLEPTGNLSDIVFQITSGGEGSTIVDYPEQLQKHDLLSFMDNSTRAKIMKLVR